MALANQTRLVPQPLESQWFLLGVGWVLIAVFVLLFGWVEDVAARKRPRLLP